MTAPSIPAGHRPHEADDLTLQLERQKRIAQEVGEQARRIADDSLVASSDLVAARNRLEQTLEAVRKSFAGMTKAVSAQGGRPD